MAPTNTTNPSKETNESEITQEDSVPSLCSWAHTPNTIKIGETQERKMCHYHLKEWCGLQRRTGFFTDASQIYYRKPIKSSARL